MPEITTTLSEVIAELNGETTAQGPIQLTEPFIAHYDLTRQYWHQDAVDTSAGLKNLVEALFYKEASEVVLAFDAAVVVAAVGVEAAGIDLASHIAPFIRNTQKNTLDVLPESVLLSYIVDEIGDSENKLVNSPFPPAVVPTADIDMPELGTAIQTLFFFGFMFNQTTAVNVILALMGARTAGMDFDVAEEGGEEPSMEAALDAVTAGLNGNLQNGEINPDLFDAAALISSNQNLEILLKMETAFAIFQKNCRIHLYSVASLAVAAATAVGAAAGAAAALNTHIEETSSSVHLELIEAAAKITRALLRRRYKAPGMTEMYISNDTNLKNVALPHVNGHTHYWLRQIPAHRASVDVDGDGDGDVDADDRAASLEIVYHPVAAAAAAASPSPTAGRAAGAAAAASGGHVIITAVIVNELTGQSGTVTVGTGSIVLSPRTGFQDGVPVPGGAPWYEFPVNGRLYGLAGVRMATPEMPIKWRHQKISMPQPPQTAGFVVTRSAVGASQYKPPLESDGFTSIFSSTSEDDYSMSIIFGGDTFTLGDFQYNGLVVSTNGWIIFPEHNAEIEVKRSANGDYVETPAYPYNPAADSFLKQPGLAIPWDDLQGSSWTGSGPPYIGYKLDEQDHKLIISYNTTEYYSSGARVARRAQVARRGDGGGGGGSGARTKVGAERPSGDVQMMVILHLDKSSTPKNIEFHCGTMENSGGLLGISYGPNFGVRTSDSSFENLDTAEEASLAAAVAAFTPSSWSNTRPAVYWLDQARGLGGSTYEQEARVLHLQAAGRSGHEAVFKWFQNNPSSPPEYTLKITELPDRAGHTAICDDLVADRLAGVTLWGTSPYQKYSGNGDNAALQNRSITFEWGHSVAAVGDPYITPVYGPKYKLPDRYGLYRYISSRAPYEERFTIDVDVLGLTKKQQREGLQTLMRKYKDCLVKYNKKVVLDGFFFRNYLLTNKGEKLLVDTEDNTINNSPVENFKVAEDSLFTVKVGGKQTITMDSRQGKTGIALYTVSIATHHETYGDITIELYKFENPQWRNGIMMHTNKRITHENSKGLILGFQHAKNFAIKKLGSKKDILDFDTKKISNAKEIVEEFSYIEEEGAEITTKKVINRFKQQR